MQPVDHVLTGPLPVDGGEDHAALISVVSDRQIRARERRHDDLAVDDKSQRHRVLVLSQKTFGPVDGIERPETGRMLGGSSLIDPAENVGERRFRDCGTNLIKHRFAQPLMFASPQVGRVLFSNDRIIRKRIVKPPADDRLRGIVGHSHRTAVVLFSRLDDARLHLSAERCSLGYGRQSDIQFVGIVHVSVNPSITK